MAGGVWFLGQAVAQADEQTNTVGQENSQSATGEGGVTGNIGGNSNESSNEVDIDIDTDVDGGDGGTNNSNVNTGVQGAIVVVVSAGDGRSAPPMASYVESPDGNHGSGDATGVINIETHSVSVEQNANGGSVSGSGNVSLPKLPNQTNEVWQSNHQTATSEDGHHGWPRKGGEETFSSMGMGGGHHGLTGNIGGNRNESENEIDIDIDTDVQGGDGGENNSNVNTGLQGVILACVALHGDDAKCKVDIETGSVEVVQNANGGNVSDSGNVGGSHSRHPADHQPAKECASPSASPGVSPAAKPVAKPMALSSAQPSGSLAFTGSDVGLPLVLGLLALVLGGGLTLAGRRRETATV
jgi:hypothetical protein